MSDNRVVRDTIMRHLKMQDFTPEQLQTIDRAMMKALAGYEVTPAETHLATIDNCVPEIMQYLMRKRAKGLKKETLEQYALVLKYFSIYVPKKLNDITEWDILLFLDNYEKDRKISKGQKDHMRVILNGFFRYQADCGNIKVNPMATIEPIKYKKTEREPLTEMELEQLRYTCSKPKERALLEFFFSTGCRVSEVVNVNIEDIDFTTRTLKVTGKGDKERTVCLSAGAVLALDRYLKTRVDNTPALFVSDKQPHQRLKKEALEKIIRMLGERAELDRRTFPHLIRHTTATYLLKHGMPLEQVQDYLGHENINTTRIYAKSDREAMINSFKKCMI